MPDIKREGLTAKGNSPYKASITRDQYMFHEMRATAKLMTEGLRKEEVINRIVEDNLFQYPTEKSLRRAARLCIKRLEAMEDEDLIKALAAEPVEDAKQIALYAMMKESRLVWDFMITVIGDKYRQHDTSFRKKDVNVFFLRLQEQDDLVAGWSSSTVEKIKQVLVKVLVENDYLDNTKSEKLNPVLITRTLENAIRYKGDEASLPAFNCFF